MPTIITNLQDHEWMDKDIEDIETVQNEEGLYTVELQFKTGTQAVLLDREDVIELATAFHIVKLI